MISWQMEWLAYSTRRRMGNACKNQNLSQLAMTVWRCCVRDIFQSGPTGLRGSTNFYNCLPLTTRRGDYHLGTWKLLARKKEGLNHKNKNSLIITKVYNNRLSDFSSGSYHSRRGSEFHTLIKLGLKLRMENLIDNEWLAESETLLEKPATLFPILCSLNEE